MTALPEASLTVPEIWPVKPCPLELLAVNIAANAANKAYRVGNMGSLPVDMSVAAMLVQYQREVNRIFRICCGRVGRSGPEWRNANLNKNPLVCRILLL